MLRCLFAYQPSTLIFPKETCSTEGYLQRDSACLSRHLLRRAIAHLWAVEEQHQRWRLHFLLKGLCLVNGPGEAIYEEFVAAALLYVGCIRHF